MTNEEWYKETHRRLGCVARYFKPKENQIIVDFIATAKDLSKEEEGKK